jgi:hypothetical protein
MKSIVVNISLVAALLFIAATGLEGQKPAIDLISSYQQNRHPEAIIDTASHVYPTVREQDSLNVLPSQNENRKIEPEKKSRRQIGPSLDSLFQKEKIKRNTGEKQQLKIAQIIKQYQFLKIFIYITALK